MTTEMITTPRSVVRRAIRGTDFVQENENSLVPHRLPDWTRKQFADAGMDRVSHQLAGVYLDFDTLADVIELEVTLTRLLRPHHTVSERPAIFVTVVDGEGVDRAEVTAGVVVRPHPDGTVSVVDGGPTRVRLATGTSSTQTRVQLWLPHNAAVEIISVAASAPLSAGANTPGLRWVHHGSSISQCIEADGPLGTWPTVAARKLGWALTNLGFAGQAMLDPFVARTIRDLPADVITLKLGINLINGDAMRSRTFVPAVHNFIDIIRERHPDTPLVLLSPISCPIHETTPGPTLLTENGDHRGDPDNVWPGALTLSIVRDHLEHIASTSDDAHLHYLDGRTLLGEGDVGHLYDHLHPDAAGYRLMGTRFADIAPRERWIDPSLITVDGL